MPVEMGLGEGALCKNVQKLRPPPRQRGVGRRMAPQSGDLNPNVSTGEVSSWAQDADELCTANAMLKS